MAARAACKAPGTAERRASAAAAVPGSLNVNAPVNAGYVGSGTDTGHTGGNCEPGVNADGTYNFQFIQDFIRNAYQAADASFRKRSRALTTRAKPAYNYWNGCSTGGRQGYLLAQELGTELDGILANAPAIYWTRFQTAQMWGQIVMKDLVGGPIAAAKLTQTTASAVAACDAADGVTDGVIDDPRTCKFSATANICGTPTAPAANCLTPAGSGGHRRDLGRAAQCEGQQDLVRARSRHQLERPERHEPVRARRHAVPLERARSQLRLAHRDRRMSYPQVAQDGSRNIADVTDTFDDLDTFQRQRRQAAHLRWRQTISSSCRAA